MIVILSFYQFNLFGDIIDHTRTHPVSLIDQVQLKARVHEAFIAFVAEKRF